MTRTVPAGLQAHLDGTTTSTAKLWTITRQDGVVLRFTDHDADIPFGGNTYKSATGFQHSDIASNSNLSVDSLEILGILNSADLSETDLRGGRYDYAVVRISEVNWKDPDGDGEVGIDKGWIGEVVYDEVSGSFTTEFRSLFQVYQQNIIEEYTFQCRYEFGGPRCNRDNIVPILPDEIANNTAYAVNDVVRVAVQGASNPPITVDFQDTHYRVAVAGTTHASLPFIFHSSAGPDADTGATTLSVTGPSTFTRPAGSFVDDGFVADMVITASGFTNGANNGDFRVDSVAATSLVVTAASLVNETGDGDERLVQVNKSNGVEFTAEPALRVAGAVLNVESQSRVVLKGDGGGLIKGPVVLANPDAERGDTSGWTITQGNATAFSAVAFFVHSGTYSFQMANPAVDSNMRQAVDVVDWATEIDAGGETVTVSWWMIDADGFPDNQTPTRVDYTFKDDVGATISSTTGANKTAPTGVFLQHSQQDAIPVGTRTIEVNMFAAGSSNGNVFVDDMAITASFVAGDTAFADDDFNYGVMTFDTGLNAGLSMDVKDYDHDTKTFDLYLPMPYPIAAGDKVGVHIGCNKEPSRCIELGNSINYGGFRHVPGDDEFLRFPDSPS